MARLAYNRGEGGVRKVVFDGCRGGGHGCCVSFRRCEEVFGEELV